MCGINGFNWKDKALVKEMNNCLKHRGPDSSGCYADANISLGHTRLAVIDLSGRASQPMHYNGKCIVYNGEIYNFWEIRSELEKKGHKFISRSDTEVILHAYDQWGAQCVRRFNGMWSFCIYDGEKLFLSRDRFGQKPLFYYFDGSSFIFSSELKSILRHEVNREFNRDAVDLYFNLGFIPSPYSIYKNMHKLEPAHSLVFDLKTKKLDKHRYYSLASRKADIASLIEDSCKKRLVADVPVGLFLSGGLDSATILAVTGLEKTFSIAFEGDYDESANIRLISGKYPSSNTMQCFTLDDADIGLYTYHFDEPYASAGAFPAFQLSRLARKKATVVLSGDGGDEVFGGYLHYMHAARVEFAKSFPALIRKLIYRLLPKRRIPFLWDLREIVRLSLLPRSRYLAEKDAGLAYLSPAFRKWADEKLRSALKTSDNLTEAMIKYDILYGTLADNFLAKVDRTSMAFSLEVRCPFLDHRLVESETEVPGIFVTKPDMKKIYGQILPKKILKTRKKGFTSPFADKIQKYDLKQGLHRLYKDKVISDGWYSYYANLKGNDKLSDNYRMRLFLFWRWYLRWHLSEGVQ